MKKSFIGQLALAAVLSLLGWLLVASAQTNPDKKTVEATAKKGEGGQAGATRILYNRPHLHYVADVRYKLPSGGERVLYVVPQNKGSDLYVKGLFFVTPAFWLEENE